MRSCEKASTLASLAHDRRLTVTEKIQLTIHRAMCGPCRTYRDQIQTLRASAGRIKDPEAQTISLDAARKERIRQRLREANKS